MNFGYVPLVLLQTNDWYAIYEEYVNILYCQKLKNIIDVQLFFYDFKIAQNILSRVKTKKFIFCFGDTISVEEIVRYELFELKSSYSLINEELNNQERIITI